MTQPCCTNIMKQVDHLLKKGQVVETSDDSSNQSRAVRPDQKNVSWMKDSVKNFTKFDKLGGCLWINVQECSQLRKHA